jgi:hypothetical protein
VYIIHERFKTGNKKRSETEGSQLTFTIISSLRFHKEKQSKTLQKKISGCGLDSDLRTEVLGPY